MKPAPFDYVLPDSLDEAAAVLAQAGEDARILAEYVIGVRRSLS